MMNHIQVGNAELRVLKKIIAARGNFIRLNAKEKTVLNSLERRLLLGETDK